MHDFWQKQDSGQPLFPDILWERPERRDLAGKLLIVGGSTGGIHDVAEAYQTAKDAGIGEIRVLVPEALRKLTKHIENIDFLPATPTGNFSLKGRDGLLFSASQMSGVLLPGGLGRNSETAMLIAEFINSFRGPLTITKDAIDLLYSESKQLLEREDTLLVVSLAQLQRLAKEVKSASGFRSDLDLLIFLERLSQFTSERAASIITKFGDQLILATKGRVVSTQRQDLKELWCIGTASKTMTYWLHNQAKFYESAATALCAI